MYLQLTTKCNMTCAHCCFSATTKGENMSRKTFVAAMNLAAARGEFVTLGGGEPTVHPEFMEYLRKSFEWVDSRGVEGPILVITNGKRTKIAQQLMNMVEDGSYPLSVELSQDEWHDPISDAVLQRWDTMAFNSRKYGSYNRSIAIRTVKSIAPVGRAAEPARGITTSQDNPCCCETLLVDPIGDVYSCGCKHTKLGNVHDADLDLSFYEADYAHVGGVEVESA